MKQILEGIAHYAAKGVMHRDLKPENIMFDSDETLDKIVIVDFGLAEQVENQKFLFYKCGTPGYVAPEVINYKEQQEISLRKHYDT